MSSSERLITQIKNYNRVRPLHLVKRHAFIRNMYVTAIREYKNTSYFQYISHLYILNLRRTIYLRKNHPYITRMYNAFKNAQQQHTVTTTQKVEKKLLF